MMFEVREACARRDGWIYGRNNQTAFGPPPLSFQNFFHWKFPPKFMTKISVYNTKILHNFPDPHLPFGLSPENSSILAGTGFPKLHRQFCLALMIKWYQDGERGEWVTMARDEWTSSIPGVEYSAVVIDFGVRKHCEAWSSFCCQWTLSARMRCDSL